MLPLPLAWCLPISIPTSTGAPLVFLVSVHPHRGIARAPLAEPWDEALETGQTQYVSSSGFLIIRAGSAENTPSARCLRGLNAGRIPALTPFSSNFTGLPLETIPSSGHVLRPADVVSHNVMRERERCGERRIHRFSSVPLPNIKLKRLRAPVEPASMDHPARRSGTGCHGKGPLLSSGETQNFVLCLL